MSDIKKYTALWNKKHCACFFISWPALKKTPLYALISSQHEKDKVGNTIIEQYLLIVF